MTSGSRDMVPSVDMTPVNTDTPRPLRNSILTRKNDYYVIKIIHHAIIKYIQLNKIIKELLCVMLSSQR